MTGTVVGQTDPSGPTEAMQTLPPTLQTILDNSEPTPAGRSFYPTDDLGMREAALNLAAQPGYYVVDIHGTADRAKVGRTWLDVDQLSALIRATPDWDGQDIFLMSCETGRRTGGFAQQLADSLEVDVTAPDKLAWSDVEPDGGAQPYSSDGCVDGFGMPRPIKPPTGTFLTFTPAVRASGASDGGRSAELTGADETALGLLHRQGVGTASTVVDRDQAKHPAPAARAHPRRRDDLGDQHRGG